MAGNEGNGNVDLSVILRRIMNMAVKKTVVAIVSTKKLRGRFLQFGFVEKIFRMAIGSIFPSLALK